MPEHDHGWRLRRSLQPAPFSELGFIRVSMSPGYRASLLDAQTALADITTRKQAQFLSDDLPARRLPSFTSYSDATDAYLVELARSHGLKLATLDDVLCAKVWAAGTAENPIASPRTSAQ